MTGATTKITPAVVLLIEDDPGGHLLAKEVFGSLRPPHELRIVSDSKEALDYLYQRGNYAWAGAASRPDLILLDLNMPRLNGQTVAEQIHSDPSLREIPVVALTTSGRHEDVLRAYGRGVSSFLTKPLDFTAVRELERLIQYARALPTVRERARLSDPQIFRLLRRRRELKAPRDAVFEQQMSQIQKVLGQGAETSAEEEIDRVAQRVREARAQGAAEPAQGTPGLVDLARALDAAASESA